MPLTSVLAIPMLPGEESLVHHCNCGNNQPPIEALQQDVSLLTQGRIIYIKSLQLIFTILTAILFMYEKSVSDCSTVDLLISGFLGSLLMYPIIVLSLPKYIKLGNTLVVLNLISCLMLFANGIFMFNSWYQMEKYLISDAIKRTNLLQKSQNFKFLPAMLSFILSTVYLSEIFIQIMDAIKSIFN